MNYVSGGGGQNRFIGQYTLVYYFDDDHMTTRTVQYCNNT